STDVPAKNGAKEIRPFEVFLIRPPRTRERWGVTLISNDLLEALLTPTTQDILIPLSAKPENTTRPCG
ncbi:MAG: hypothetical protein OXF24_08295, partial [Hyphomicrobiales bacterium]|nr:hypothetical protein [Hyphomicrobiales bacterium]